MKKYLLLLSFLGFVSCSSLGEPEGSDPVAEDYFFQQSTGFQYTYSHDDLITSDTSTYQVVVKSGYGEFSRLEKFENGASVGTETLYLFKTWADPRDGMLQCILSTQSGTGENIIALQGALNIGNTWKANTDGSIIATVEDHYDFYYLVGREKKYDDVFVVKYVDSREEEGTYTLRYFANGYGLVHEKRIIGGESGPTSEISNLRLIGTIKPNTIPQQPDRWWDAQGRYSIAPALSQDELD
jgi:hypothetical protein